MELSEEEYQKWARQIIREQQGPLLRYITKISHVTSIAEEVVQNTFIKFLETPHQEIYDYVLPWLFRVSRNLALDWLRSQGLHQEKEAQLALEDNFAPSSEEINLARDLNVLVLKLVSKLPLRERDVVVLKFQNEFSYKEIAKITGLTENQVGTVLHEAILKIKMKLEKLNIKEKGHGKKAG